MVSTTDDNQKILVMVDSPSRGPAYAIVDMATHTANYVGEQYPGLTTGDISPVHPLSFRARDGLELHGYLTLPHSSEAKNLPLVVLPHGGPAAHDMLGLDWFVQALASRGYAVLQVNYRGSDSYGWDFLKAGFGEWGRKMQTDLSDGVRHLAAQGVGRPEAGVHRRRQLRQLRQLRRLCGSGRGGPGPRRLSLRGVGRRAVGSATLPVLASGPEWVRAQRYWARFMGADDAGAPALKALSPSEHAAEVAIPILLVHGRDDTVAPMSQSQGMADALKQAGKPVELGVLEGEDHWLTRGATRLATLQAVVALLEKNNPPR